MSLSKGLSMLLVFSRKMPLASLTFSPSAPERLKQVLEPGDRFLSGGSYLWPPGTVSWNLLVDLWVRVVIGRILGQQNGFWHSPKDFLVTEAICALLGQHGQVLHPVGRIPSGRSYLCPSGSAGLGNPGIFPQIWERQLAPLSGVQDGRSDLFPPLRLCCWCLVAWEHSQGKGFLCWFCFSPHVPPNNGALPF